MGVMIGAGRRVFVSSPYRGNVTRNVDYARQACRMIALRGDLPFAPHLLYPQFLDDNDPNERTIGIWACSEWMRQCDIIESFHGYGVSAGMSKEIAEADKLGLPIFRRDTGS